MTSVERSGSDFVIDAEVLVEAFDLSEDKIRTRMREGAITSLCESGVDDDAGFWRLTFYHGDRACRFVVDAEGTILKRTIFPVKPRQPNTG